MESLYFLVPVALVFLVLAVRLLFWAVNSGQYDDLDTEGHRILFDDKPATPPAASSSAPAPTGSGQDKPQVASGAATKSGVERAEPGQHAAEQATVNKAGSDGRRDER